MTIRIQTANFEQGTQNATDQDESFIMMADGAGD